MVHMQNVRVVQRNLVYAVGLAMEICYEDTLMGPEFFGAFGKMVKQMSVNRMGPYGSAVSRNGPTGSAYITFKRPEDAKRCIEAVNGVTWGGKFCLEITHMLAGQCFPVYSTVDCTCRQASEGVLWHHQVLQCLP